MEHDWTRRPPGRGIKKRYPSFHKVGSPEPGTSDARAFFEIALSDSALMTNSGVTR